MERSKDSAGRMGSIDDRSHEPAEADSVAAHDDRLVVAVFVGIDMAILKGFG